jgi:serine/threonine protein kinase
MQYHRTMPSIERGLNLVNFLDKPFLTVEKKYGKCSYWANFIVPYFPEGDMEQIVGSVKRHSEQSILKYALHICCSIASLHAQDMMHRDIKPGNMLLWGDVPYLFDFEEGVLTREDIKQETEKGTKLFNAPELLLGKGYENKVDVYAFGVTLVQFMTRQTFGELRDALPKECCAFYSYGHVVQDVDAFAVLEDTLVLQVSFIYSTKTNVIFNILLNHNKISF